MQSERGDEQEDGDEPRAALAPQDTPGEHDHPYTGDRGKGAGRLDDRDGQILRNQVQVHPEGSRDRGEQIDDAGHEQQDRREAADAAHPYVVRRHLGRGRP